MPVNRLIIWPLVLIRVLKIRYLMDNSESYRQQMGYTRILLTTSNLLLDNDKTDVLIDRGLHISV